MTRTEKSVDRNSTPTGTVLTNVAYVDETRGEWAIENFTVTPQQAERASAMAFILSERGALPAGNYVRLVHEDRGIVMSNTPDELRDHSTFVRQARGSVSCGKRTVSGFVTFDSGAFVAEGRPEGPRFVATGKNASLIRR